VQCREKNWEFSQLPIGGGKERRGRHQGEPKLPTPSRSDVSLTPSLKVIETHQHLLRVAYAPGNQTGPGQGQGGGEVGGQGGTQAPVHRRLQGF
jgi:hypothetical protein